MVYAANLSICLLSSVWDGFAVGHGGGVAAGKAFDPGRGHGTAVLLRLGVGGDGIASAPTDGLEDTAGDTHGERGEARHLCECAAADGLGGVSRCTPTDSPYCAGRVDGRGLRLGQDFRCLAVRGFEETRRLRRVPCRG